MTESIDQITSNNAATKSKRGLLGWVCFLFALLLLAGSAAGFFLWHKTQEEIRLLHSYVNKVEQNLALKSQATAEFQKKISQMSAENKSQDLVLSDHLKELESNMLQLDGQFKKVTQATLSNDVWLLSEVEYLLKTADHRILMKADVKGAVAILKSADSLIKKMPLEDAGLTRVRVAIAQDIAQLQGSKAIDVPGTYAELTSLSSQIERLPLVQTAFSHQADSPNTAKQDILAKINQTMRGFIKVKKHDVKTLKAMLSDEDRLSLKNGLRLSIEQAQTALLLGDQRIYDDSLSRVRQAVHQYFVADNFKVKLALKKIDALFKVQVKQELPDISASQQALKRYLNERALQS